MKYFVLVNLVHPLIPMSMHFGENEPRSTQADIKCKAVIVEEFQIGDFYLVQGKMGFKVLGIDARIIGERTITVRSMNDGAISKFRYDKNMRLDYVMTVNGRDPRVPRG